MQEAGSIWIYRLCQLNPFTHAVEAMRAGLAAEAAAGSMFVVIAATLVFYLVAAAGYDPQRGLIKSARGS